MATIRWARSEGTTPAKVRWARSEGEGSLPASPPKLRWARSEATGAVAVVLAPLTDRVVEPLTTQSITVALAAGSATPTSYVWRRVSGPAVTIVGAGATVTIVAPAHLDGTSVVLGVKGVLSGVESVERTIRIDTLPHSLWASTTSGWVAASHPVPL